MNNILLNLFFIELIIFIIWVILLVWDRNSCTKFIRKQDKKDKAKEEVKKNKAKAFKWPDDIPPL